MAPHNNISPPTIVDAYLKRFSEVNPHIQIRTDVESLILENPWGGNNVSLSIPLVAHPLLQDLNNIWLYPAFDAVLHLDLNLIEFLFIYIDPHKEPHSSYLNREFTVYFEGREFKCRFDAPSHRAMWIARHSQDVPSDDSTSTVPQLAAFRDAQRLNELPERLKSYFTNKEPRNFFVSAPCDLTTIDLPGLARHLNFICHYYDRNAPEIVIRTSGLQSEKWSRRRYLDTQFPEALSLGTIDEIVLQLTHVARMSPPRFAFLYYYQVLEYAGHYFVDEKARSQLRKFVRDPALINCDDRKIGELLSLLTEVNHNDDVKMKRVIEDIVDPAIVWREIEHDKDFFTSSVDFDGGFSLGPLVSRDTSPDSWGTMWMPKLFDQLTKIRNALVHARERRENRVILPTPNNNRKLARYQPVIARVSEQIALSTRAQDNS